MKTAYSLASALLLSSSLSLPATAADLTTAPTATGYNWNGFYVGVGGGIGAITHEIGISPLAGFEFNGIGGEGYFGELTVGYDMQLTERIVAGVFATYRAGNMATTLDIDAAPFFTFDADVTLDHGYDVIGRVGYLVTPNTLAYVLGGYSHQHFALDTSIGFDMDWDADGYVLGGGLEAVLAGNWTLKSEYRYGQYDLGNFGLGSFLDVESSTHTFHTALAYRFGGGATAAAAAFAPVSYDFAGLKVGIAGGLGAVVHELDILGGIANFNGIGGEGAFGEVSIGYDFRIAPNWIAGVQADYRWGNISTDLDLSGLGFDASITADHGYDLIARLGYEVYDNTLIYGLAGMSWQHFQLDTSISGIDYDWDTHGWTAGAGIEAALSDRVTAKVEYRYAEYDGEDFESGGILEAIPSMHTVRFGLSYKIF